jgi:hypothetical protein
MRTLTRGEGAAADGLAGDDAEPASDLVAQCEDLDVFVLVAYREQAM